MDNRERELYELSNQIAEKLSSLPNDGSPRQITVTQSGDGTVVMGSQVIINPPAARDIPVHERPVTWLRDVIKENKRQINEARFRKWFSIPSIIIHSAMLMFLVFVGSIVLPVLIHRDASLFTQSVGAVIQQPAYMMIFCVAIGLLAVWFGRVSKVEDRIISESKGNIEYISTILKRRKA
ncbi:hypothetical protein [Serratia ficaria]|uniref:hypothetical protein n=1 Tax=Serratia ficaria TaxID=61651 RepID=UPI00217933DB|nr:hypothetical protein [Serratia ficaria]CAI0906324.1 Uncharacterised protein [Serratia ficaria]CAI1083973.1 Uncharacterised protein [Serratia ficaria]CAI1597674.1 Uncharacterised protein [Serratia ficaria]CAI2399873.1 Uncharacterised protein [Serratia ficaria]CAI2494694.1 Uncharacterised protein [Serratia ficaria]